MKPTLDYYRPPTREPWRDSPAWLALLATLRIAGFVALIILVVLSLIAIGFSCLPEPKQ